MVCGDADNLAQEDHMVAAVVLSVGSAFKARGTAGKDGYAAGTWFKFHAFELVDIAHGKAPGQVLLVLAENVNAEMFGFLESGNIARRPAQRPQDQGRVHGYGIEAVGRNAKGHASLITRSNDCDARDKQAKRVPERAGVEFHTWTSKVVSVWVKGDFPVPLLR